MPLYGHELSESWDPITAGQRWVVSFEKEFIGRAALERVQSEGPSRALCGLDVDSRRTPRAGAEILVDGQPAGVVTSGVMSPTLGRVIAMGFLPTRASEVGQAVEIDLKTSQIPARVTKLPFYKAPKRT